MPKIHNITCHKVVNSRGDWTIETKVELEDGSIGSQVVPDGASKGEHEAVYIPVGKAVDIITSALSEVFHDENPFDQTRIDNMLIDLDGTENKRNLGANTILSISLAVCKAAAKSRGLELYDYLQGIYGKSNVDMKFPVPIFNILNGGKHADNNLSFQEFMVIPSGNLSFEEACELGVTIYHGLEKKLKDEDFDTDVGDEGGFAPNGLTIQKAMELIRKVSQKKYKVGEEVFFGFDIAADSFRRWWRYLIREEELSMNSNELHYYLSLLLNKFEIIYCEDPFHEKDHQAWEKFVKDFGKRVMVVGDDLTVTNPNILKSVIQKNLCNAVIVKPNQIGTLTETLEFIRIAQDNNLRVIISHRSGDSAEDTFIADLSLAVRADFLKSGAPARGERVAKYNRLLDVFYQDHDV